ncbi:Extensin [Burkholderiales bacterium 8X]|nr:Extensin [Burkholderiales bacterium 8X]
MPPDRVEGGPRRWFLRTAFLAVVLAAAACGWAIREGRLQVPDRYNPWAPLDVSAEPNWLTAFKLDRARREAPLCQAALADSGLSYEPVPDRVTGEGCGFENAVRLRKGSSIALGSPAVLSCRMALSFAMWERHALQPAAWERLGTPIASIEHLGSYACRNVNTGEGATQGSRTGRRSMHSTADAFDIAGFSPQRGSRITVRRDWQGSDPQAMFLHDVHQGACRYFKGVLGPDYNAVHADHLHLEVGGWSSCR